jgi:chromate transporter
MKNNKENNSLMEILASSSKLGLTSFGGPIAHLGYFKKEYVDRRKWINDETYADIIALCQFLPGPASSQVGISIGIIRGGVLGGIISWLGFTLPSVIMLALFALAYQKFNISNSGIVHGLKITAVAVVAQAILGMGKKLTPDKQRITIAIISAAATLAIPSVFGQIAIIILAGILGVLLYKNENLPSISPISINISKKAGILAWVLFFGLIIALPLLRQQFQNSLFNIFDIFYRVGSLVFGGGHVVLPLIEREVVPSGLITAEQFIAGYAAAQAVPGPLFTLASYIGTMINGLSGMITATVAMFLPSFLLVIGSLPFLNEIRKHPKFQSALVGINAAVVGILLAAFFNPVWISSIKTNYDFIAATALFGLLEFWKLAPWKVVIIGALSGFIIGIL